MFKVGDKVKKVNGNVFGNGQPIAIVRKVEESSYYGGVRVWLVNGGWISPESIVLVEPAKIGSFKQFQRKLDGADVIPEAQRIRTGPSETLQDHSISQSFNQLFSAVPVYEITPDEVGFDEEPEWDDDISDEPEYDDFDQAGFGEEGVPGVNVPSGPEPSPHYTNIYNWYITTDTD